MATWGCFWFLISQFIPGWVILFLVFLDHIHMWACLCMVYPAFVDGAVSCAHTQWCPWHMFDVVLPEGTKTTGIQYWVLALMTRYLMSLQFYVEEHFFLNCYTICRWFVEKLRLSKMLFYLIMWLTYWQLTSSYSFFFYTITAVTQPFVCPVPLFWRRIAVIKFKSNIFHVLIFDIFYVPIWTNYCSLCPNLFERLFLGFDSFFTFTQCSQNLWQQLQLIKEPFLRLSATMKSNWTRHPLTSCMSMSSGFSHLLRETGVTGTTTM